MNAFNREILKSSQSIDLNDVQNQKSAKIKAVNKTSFFRKLASLKKKPLSLTLYILVLAAAAATVAVILFLLGYILINGIPNLKADLFAWEYNSVNVSMTPAIINTLIMAVITLLLAAPIGIFAAVYLVEYSKKNNKAVAVIRMAAETLAGIPSIVYGLFGMLFFVLALNWGFSMLAGAFTLAIMVLPLIMRTTEEALLSVPDSYREGSYALGAGKIRTIFKVILPSALPGIMSGIILSIGRVVGETAALIFTAGTVAAIPDNIMGSGRTLAIHMYVLANEGLHVAEANATAVILLVFVILINGLSSLIAGRLSKGRK